MKKLYLLVCIPVLFLTTCITKQRYQAMEQTYKNRLKITHKKLAESEENGTTLRYDTLLLRKKIVACKKILIAYRDSLQQWKKADSLAQKADSLNKRTLFNKITKLKQTNEKIWEELTLLEKENQQWKQKYYHSLANQQQTEDSIQQLKSLLQKSYTSAHNYTETIHLFQNTFDCYIVNSKKSTIQFFWKNKEGKKYKSFKKLQEELFNKNKTLLFATNAGMFTPKHTPQGWYVEKGKEFIPIDLQKKGYGNFYMKPNGIFLLDKQKTPHIISSEKFSEYKNNVLYATQSGPMLVLDHHIHSCFTPGSTNKYIRSGVGIINQNQIVFIISRKPVNFYDFASVFKERFGCTQALYLDGAISKMFLPQAGRLDLGGDFGPLIGIVK